MNKMNRREFLRVGGQIALVSGGTGAMVWTDAATARTSLTGRGVVLVDQRYPDSLHFARSLAATGADPLPVQADCVRLWHGNRAALRRDDLAWIAGLTTGIDRELMKSCAAPFGFREVFRGSHDGRGDGGIRHTLLAPSVEFQPARIFGDAAWAERLAQALIDCGEPTVVAGVAAAVTPRPAGYPGTLFSWLLRRAPVGMDS